MKNPPCMICKHCWIPLTDNEWKCEKTGKWYEMSIFGDVEKPKNCDYFEPQKRLPK